jgi:hypothetical protein
MNTVCSFQSLGLLKVSSPNHTCRIYHLNMKHIAFIEEIVINGVHYVIKITLLPFYLRLFPDQSFRRLVYLESLLRSVVFLSSL